MLTAAYRIVSALPVDGSGLWYRAQLDDGGTEVDVLLVETLDAAQSQLTQKRLALASQLDHPAAARVLAARLDAESPTYLIEPLAGPDLAEILRSRPAPQQLLGYARQLASVLAAAHRLGLTHGQLAPDAVRVREDGSLQLDFIRRDLQAATEARASRAAFLAPEVVDHGESDSAADAYSLAALLVWLFAGAVVGLPQWRARLQEQLTGFDVEPDALVCLSESIGQALRTDPAERAGCREISAALERMATPMALAGGSPSPQDQTAEWSAPTQFVQQTVVDGTRIAAKRVGDQIGRFRILRKLGEGGMGEVFMAGDPSDGSIVAIKLLRRALHDSDAARRFHKEARLLGEIKSPYVTNLLEVNEDDGLQYIVMEYVAGVDLRRMIQQAAPLEERVALSIIADAARGLVSAHERGIIHRDIKPANILLAYDRGDDHTTAELPSLSLDSLKDFHVKLSDFGLAREVDQSESMQLTMAGRLLGTPLYMSPEQFSNLQDATPATDVYAMGITLFEMLAGRPPFMSGDAMQLMRMHSLESLPALPKLNPRVSEATWEIVQRALAKKIEDRYADARQLLQDIERLLRGKASNIAVHPQTPPHDADEVLEETFQWQLRAAPSDLWPHVSNTERINAAVGVPSVVYRTGRDERGRLRKYGSFRLAGIPIGWEEHPFEWVEGQQLGILREFQQGPFEWFLSLVELRPQSGGGTLLQHRVRVKPRGLVGRMLARLEVSIKGKRNLDRVYRRIDDAVSGRLGGEPTIDPFAQPKKLAAGRRQRLDERLGKLAERGVSQQVLACLAEFLRESPAQELARIRPLALARNFHVPAEPLVEGCLLAAKEGLLDLHWDILCPTCRISSQVVDTLQAIENHVRCEACDLDFNVDLASSVEMIFRVSPEIREADLGTYCIGGPEHSPHVVLQVRIEAGKRLEVTPVLSEGEYILRSPQLAMVVRLRALPGRGTANSEIVLLAGLAADHVAQVRAGRNVLSITNDCDQELIVRLERTVPRQDVLTAAQAATMPAFREFFPNESPKPGQLLNVATVTLLAVDIPDTSPLYFELEDAAAYSLVQRFHRTIEQTLRKHGGAMIKTAGTAVLFVFETPRNVIPAVVELSAALQQDRGNVPFCATAHRGTALATSSGGHLDFFGGTVHLVERLLRLAGSGELLVTEAVAAEQTVVAAMGQAGLTAEFCDFHQLSRGGMRCRRLRLT